MTEKGNRGVLSVLRPMGGLIRVSDAVARGIPRSTFYSLRDSGQLTRVSRGIYRLASRVELSEPDLVTVAKRMPSGVICLISALAYHGLTTQIPHAVDVAVRRGQRGARIEHPPINIYQFSDASFRSGLETYRIDGVQVKIFSPEKSVVDIFKFRNKVGMDVALEALKLWKEKGAGSPSSLMKQARACRVERVLQPYLEAIL